LRQLLSLIDSHAFQVNGQQPPKADILGRLRADVKDPARRQLAARPNV
jgi:hypothetical protein